MIVCNLDREVSNQMAFGRLFLLPLNHSTVTVVPAVTRVHGCFSFAPQPWPKLLFQESQKGGV